MTDFEQIKIELHKLVDGLDEDKLKLNSMPDPHFVSFFERINIQIFPILQDLQKEPTLEEKLQELGFVDERTTSGLPKLSYVIPKYEFKDSDTVWLSLRCGSHSFTLHPRLNNEKEILKCARFLKELRDE